MWAIDLDHVWGLMATPGVQQSSMSEAHPLEQEAEAMVNDTATAPATLALMNAVTLGLVMAKTRDDDQGLGALPATHSGVSMLGPCSSSAQSICFALISAQKTWHCIALQCSALQVCVTGIYDV